MIRRGEEPAVQFRQPVAGLIEADLEHHLVADEHPGQSTGSALVPVRTKVLSAGT